MVEDSRPAIAPLHRCFEWSDERAAERYREEQARLLIRSVRVCVQGDPAAECQPVRMFVNVTEGEDRHYTSVACAMSDDALRKQVLDAAKAEMGRFAARYREFQELAGVLNAIDTLLAA